MSYSLGGELPLNPGSVTGLPHDFVRPAPSAIEAVPRRDMSAEQAQFLGLNLLGSPEVVEYGWPEETTA